MEQFFRRQLVVYVVGILLAVLSILVSSIH